MKPTPWVQESVDARERRAADALAGAQTEPVPWSSQRERQVLEAIRARVAEPAGLPRSFWIFAAASLALVIVVAGIRRVTYRPPTEIVQASEGADYRLTPSKAGQPASLKLIRGSLSVSATAGASYELDTPGLRAHLHAQQFQVQVAGAFCTLRIVSGSAEVLAVSGEVVHLGAGQSIQSTDPRLQPPAPAPAPSAPGASGHAAASDPCPGLGNLALRRACYARVSHGDDLAAQNAILELGMLDQEEARDGAAALEDWRSYQRRFPEGPLGPEASVAILGELLAEHRLPDAQQEADRFLARYPQDGRAGQVLLSRAEVRCQTQGAGALADFDHLANQVGIDRAELLLRRGSCEAQVGQNDAAHAHWRQALQATPTASQGAALHRLLGD